MKLDCQTIGPPSPGPLSECQSDNRLVLVQTPILHIASPAVSGILHRSTNPRPHESCASVGRYSKSMALYRYVAFSLKHPSNGEHGPPSSRCSALVLTHNFPGPFDACRNDFSCSTTTSPITSRHLYHNHLQSSWHSGPASTPTLSVRQRCIYSLQGAVVRRQSVSRLSRIDFKTSALACNSNGTFFIACTLSLLTSCHVDFPLTPVVPTPIRASSIGLGLLLPIASARLKL